MKQLLLAAGLMIVGALGLQDTASALGLKIAPLEYRTTLKSGEFKKGFIDISNPENTKVIVRTSVQAFRQTDNNGTLEFYDDEQLTRGVKLDLKDFELGPREAVRMYFLLDSKALPTGDSYGGIFFTTEPTKPTQGSGQSVKLGTILSIVNGTPGSRKAIVTHLDIPSFQLDTKVNGTYAVKNTGDPDTSSGFYPQVTLSVNPFGEKRSQTSKLVFAGRTRENVFTVNTPPLGFYNVKVAYGDSVQSKWIFIANPGAVAVLVLVVSLVIAVLKVYLRHFRKSQKTIASK